MRRCPQVCWLTLLLLAPLASACGRSADDEAAIQEDLEGKGTIELMDEIAEAEYDPPSDGKLTEEQVRMYLEVRKRERQIVEVARKNLEEKSEEAEKDGKEGGEMGFFEALGALGDIADIGTADLRAAHDLGHNTAEYQWVKQQIAEVQMAEMTEGLEQMASSFQEQAISALEAQKAATTDDAEKRQIEEQIAELRKENGEADAGAESSEALRHNARLVAEYREQIDAVQSDVTRALNGPTPDAGAGREPGS